MQKGTLYNNNF